MLTLPAGRRARRASRPGRRLPPPAATAAAPVLLPFAWSRWLPAAPAALPLLAAALARSALPGDLAPLHVAFCAAVPRRVAVVTAAASLAAVLAWRGPAAAWLDALVLLPLVALKLRMAAPGEDAVRGRGPLAAALAGGCTLLGGLVWAAWSGAGLAGTLAAAFRAAAAATLAPLFAGGLRVLACLSAAGGARQPARLTRDEALLLGTLACAVLSGLAGARIGPLDLFQALGTLLVLAAAAAGGSGLATGTAAACAGLAALVGGASPVAALAQVVAGLLAGSLRHLGTAGLLAGYGLGTLALSALYREPREVTAALVSLGAGMGLFVALARLLRPALPVPLLEPAAGAQPAAAGPVPAGPVGPLRASAPGAGGAGAEGDQGRREAAPPAAGDPWEGLASVCRELAEAVAAPPEGDRGEASPTTQGVADLVGTLAGRVCAGCPHTPLCWQRDFLKTYAGLLDTLARHEQRGGVDERDLPEHLRRRCPRTAGLLAAIRYVYDLRRAEQRERERLREHRRLLAQQLLGLGEAVSRLGRHGSRAPSPRRMGYRVGVARVPRVPGRVSGDSCLTRALPDGRLALVLSDGMGSGERAAEQSRAAVRLLERLLSAGFDEGDAVRAVNAVLLLRNASEAYATLDLALVDLARGHVRFVKVGAAPSFIRRGDRVRVVRAGSPPAGILPELKAEVRGTTLMPGDVVVMTSDGALTAWPRVDAAEDWLCGFLGSLPWEDPQRIAAAVAEEALRRYGGQPRDDLTVLVLALR